MHVAVKGNVSQVMASGVMCTHYIPGWSPFLQTIYQSPEQNYVNQPLYAKPVPLIWWELPQLSPRPRPIWISHEVEPQTEAIKTKIDPALLFETLENFRGTFFP